jgi:hypothetical protein
MTVNQAPPLFPQQSAAPTREQAQRTRELQDHYRTAADRVKQTRTDERARIAAHDAKGRAK